MTFHKNYEKNERHTNAEECLSTGMSIILIVITGNFLGINFRLEHTHELFAFAFHNS